jgi:hypothetical protein
VTAEQPQVPDGLGTSLSLGSCADRWGTHNRRLGKTTRWKGPSWPSPTSLCGSSIPTLTCGRTHVRHLRVGGLGGQDDRGFRCRALDPSGDTLHKLARSQFTCAPAPRELLGGAVSLLTQTSSEGAPGTRPYARAGVPPRRIVARWLLLLDPMSTDDPAAKGAALRSGDGSHQEASSSPECGQLVDAPAAFVHSPAACRFWWALNAASGSGAAPPKRRAGAAPTPNAILRGTGPRGTDTRAAMRKWRPRIGPERTHIGGRSPHVGRRESTARILRFALPCYALRVTVSNAGWRISAAQAVSVTPSWIRIWGKRP